MLPKEKALPTEVPLLFDPLIGQTLTGIQVFDPWRQGFEPSATLPLFGAISLEFNDWTLFCKSPLRYCRDANGTLVGLEDGARVCLGFRIGLCDREQLVAYQRLLDCRGTPPLWWQRIPLAMNTGGELLYGQDIECAIGLPLAAIRLVNDPGSGIDLSFGQDRHCLRMTYREDLDGAIQFAPPSWHNSISRIDLTKPEHAFGWLLDSAPYPVCIDDRCWGSVEQYATSFDAELMARKMAANASGSVATRISAARIAVDSLLRRKARLSKFVQHSQLAKCLQAIRYPVFGSDSSPFLLPDSNELLAEVNKSRTLNPI